MRKQGGAERHFYICLFLLSIFLGIPSCEIPISISDDSYIAYNGLFELNKVSTPDNYTSDTISPPPLFIYIKFFNKTDSLYYLNTKEGELIDKWKIVKTFNYEKYTKRHKYSRLEFLLSNGKYFYLEIEKDLNYFFSQQVDNEEDLENDLIEGEYKNIAGDPDIW